MKNPSIWSIKGQAEEEVEFGLLVCYFSIVFGTIVQYVHCSAAHKSLKLFLTPYLLEKTHRKLQTFYMYEYRDLLAVFNIIYIHCKLLTPSVPPVSC